MITEKYPSGKIVSTGYDANGRLATVADPSQTYLSGMQYLGKGNSMSQMTLGNGNTETFTLNDRLQMTSQSLLKGTEVLQKYDYGYGELNSQSVLKNNGKLESVVSYIGTAKQSTQKFQYDHIGRLKESAEYRGDNNALTYKQKFDFDRFGNLYRKAASNPTTGQANPLAYTPIEDADISKATNRFATGTTYDDAGNVTTDNKFRTMSFAYDANGRQVKATRASVPDAWTVYDASGNRVATKINDVWQYMIYDTFGKLVAEYGVASEGVGGVKYVQQDWQGSVRTVTNNNGFVVGRTDHQAFGNDVGYGVGQRSVEQGYSVGKVARQGYGLTERDDATGLDHTWFRKNENQAGRWTSPDPYNGSMNLGDPQSFNRYSYVNSQPTNFVGPSGLNMVAYTSCHQRIRIAYVDGQFDSAWLEEVCETSYGWVDDVDISGGFVVDDSPLPFNNCDEFVSFLLDVSSKTLRNSGWSKERGYHNKNAAGKSLGAGLMDLSYFGYQRHIDNGSAGFKEILTGPGKQGPGVYGHVLGMAGTSLYGLVGAAIGTANSVVDRVQNFYGKADGQGPAEVAGNAAGTAVGNHIWNWLATKDPLAFKNKDDLWKNLKGELCE
jgi:RHS repeat-associated protein